jgi:hypothetical protein
MQSWISDNFDVVIILLSLAALALAYFWWRTRQRYYALGAGAAVLLLGLVCLLVFLLPLLFGESDSQQIERKVREMAAAVKARNLDRIFRHVSNTFRFGSLDRTAFRQKAEEVIRRRDVEEVIVWDFERGEIAREKRSATVSFMVKAESNWQGSEFPYRCEADFVLDSDGQWRMRGFQIFNPVVDSKEPIHIPGF